MSYVASEFVEPDGELIVDEYGEKTMTGAQLLALLQSLTPEQLALGIWTEGCDCTGSAVSIEISPERRGTYANNGEEWVRPAYLQINRSSSRL